MLQPKRTKFRRQQKGRAKGIAHRGDQLAFGSFGIKVLGTKWITGRQIEAARIAVTRYMQRQGQIWIRVFPDKPITSKPAEVRMGKGKGAPSHWVAVVKPGRILFEADGVPYETAKEAMRLAAQKLPVKCKFIVRNDYVIPGKQQNMKQQEIIKLSVEDLVARIAELKGTLEKLMLNHTVSPLENPLQIRAMRKTIARLSTELTKRAQA